jgi:copper chaperone CopZ
VRKTISRIITTFSLPLLLLANSSLAAPPAGALRIQVVADEMCCQGCVQKVAAQLYALPGVTSVEANVASRTVVITAKPSPKLTLGGLWHAVELGKGAPSKLVTTQATYTLERPDQLQLTEPLSPGRYWIVVRALSSKDAAQQITRQFYAVRGVKTVQVDIAKRTFFVESANSAPLSPWTLASAVEQAGDNAISVTGPHGVLTIERPSDQQARAATNPSQKY